MLYVYVDMYPFHGKLVKELSVAQLVLSLSTTNVIFRHFL